MHAYMYILIYMLVNQSDPICILQINEFVKRARAAKIHAYIISHLKKEMPAMIGKSKTQQRLIDNLEEEFGKVPLSLFMQIYDCEFCKQVHTNL